MADIRLNQVQTPVQNQTAPARPSVEAQIRTNKTPDRTEQNQQAEEKKRTADQERLENVIAVSEDGDTVQASEEGISRLETEENVNPAVAEEDEKEEEENGKVVVNENTVKEQIEAAEEESEKRKKILEDISTASERAYQVRDLFRAAAEEKTGEIRDQRAEELNAPEQIKSFTGYSDVQLQQLYRKGEISKLDYDREIESREEKRESQKENNEEFSRETAVEAQLTEQTARDGQMIKIAFSDDSSDTTRAEDRVDMIQKANENFDLV